MVELKEKYKIIVISFFTAFSLFLIYYFHIIIGKDVIFTHFFYIPIILGATWWRKKGVIVALILAMTLLLSDFFVRKDPLFITNDFIRSFMFIFVSSLVITLSEIIVKHEKGLKKAYVDLDLRVKERTAELSETNILLSQEIITRKRTEQDLKLYSEAMEMAPDGFLLVDFDGRMIYSNRAFEKMFGFLREELKGKNVNELNLDSEFATKVILPAIREREKWEGDLMVKHKAGQVFPVWLNASMVRNSFNEPVAMVGVIKDISDLKRAQKELYQGLQIQYLLNKLLRISLENVSLEQILGQVIDEVTAVTWFNFESKGAIFLIEDNPDELVLKTQRGMSKYFESLCARVPFGKCLCGRSVSSGEVVFADSVDERHENRYKDLGPHGHLCVPIISANQKKLGVINLYLKPGYKPNKSEIDFVQLVVNLLAGIIERKYVEKVLGESEERFRGAFESAAIGIALVAPDGRWLKVNRSLCAIVGYSEEELLSKTFQDITYREDLRIDLEYVHKMLVGEISYYQMEKRYIHKQGHIVWIFLSVSLVRDARGKPLHFVSQIEDITERKKAEDALHKTRQDLEVRVQKRTQELAKINVMLQEEISERKKIEQSLKESEEHYHRIISTITDYIYTVYVERGRVVRTVHRPGCFSATGYSQEEFSEEPYLWIQMVPEAERRMVASWSERILKGENVKPLEHRIVRKDGSLRWISNTPVFHYDSEGQLISYDGAVKDITERKLGEEERDRQETLASIIEEEPDVVVITDVNGRLLQFNKAMTEKLGFGQEAIGKPFADFVREEDVSKIAKGINQCLEKGYLKDLEVYALTKAQAKVPALINALLLKDANSNPKGSVIVMKDISGRKRLEELEDEFMYIAAHELRAPLAIVKESAAILSEGILGQLSNGQQDFLKTVKRNVDRTIRLVNNIMLYQRLDSGRVKFDLNRRDINELINGVAKEFAGAAQDKGLTLELNLKENLPAVKLDGEKITQVLMNLVGNAVRFTDKGGIIITSAKFKDEIRVCIQDTGGGIKEESIKIVFDAFSQIKISKAAKGEGTGLSLSISKKIIQRHNGKIWVESEYGKGSSFYFTLPIE